MSSHECIILRNKFSEKNNYYCHICAKQYGEISKVEEELLLDLYNLIMDEEDPIVSVDAVNLWIKFKLGSCKGENTH